MYSLLRRIYSIIKTRSELDIVLIRVSEFKYIMKHAYRLPQFIKVMNKEKLKWLDADCGSGIYYKMIKHTKPECFIVGVDVNSRRLIFKTDNFVCADVRCLPFRESVFNIVTLSHVLEHVKEPSTIVKYPLIISLYFSKDW